MEQLLWTKKQTAETLGLSLWGLYHLHRSGKLVGVKQCGKLFFCPSDVSKYVQDLKRTAAPGSPEREGKQVC